MCQRQPTNVPSVHLFICHPSIRQVRGFADQKLRKADNPLDASNRRITLIVQYIVKDANEKDAGQDSQKPISSENMTPAEGAPAESKPAQ